MRVNINPISQYPISRWHDRPSTDLCIPTSYESARFVFFSRSSSPHSPYSHLCLCLCLSPSSSSISLSLQKHSESHTHTNIKISTENISIYISLNLTHPPSTRLFHGNGRVEAAADLDLRASRTASHRRTPPSLLTMVSATLSASVAALDVIHFER